MMIIWLGGIIIFVYYVLLNKNNEKTTVGRNKSPEEKLKERFIKGEINEKEYLQMKEIIKL